MAAIALTEVVFATVGRSACADLPLLERADFNVISPLAGARMGRAFVNAELPEPILRCAMGRVKQTRRLPPDTVIHLTAHWMRDNCTCHFRQPGNARSVYIVAIAWIYVVLLMSLTETSVIAGIATFMFYGLAPLILLLWLMGTPQRRRNRHKAQAELDEQNRDGPEVEEGLRTASAENGAVGAETDGAEGNPSILEPR